MNHQNKKTSERKHRIIRSMTAVGLAAAIIGASSGDVMTVRATTISDVQKQIEQDQQNLNNIKNTLSGLTEEQELLEEMIEDINAEIINMMTSIGLKEDEIAAKETEISEKQIDIEEAQADYNAAKKREEEQYEAMKIQIRFMYENNSVSTLAKLLESSGFSNLINNAEKIEKVYEYSNDMLNQYEATKIEVQQLWDQLVIDKQQLESDKTQLENDRATLQTLKKELDTNLAAKKAESANYEADIQRYKQEAAAAQKKIQQEQKQLKKLQEEEKKRQEELKKQQQQQQQQSTSSPTTNSAINGSYTDTGYTQIIDAASGSDLGKKIAKYGCQFIGNPYVRGGTSLTNGADCSGFVWRIYKDFGYSLHRTSYEQRSDGTEVSYDEMQPGDLVCYSGHVAMYIGGGKIVHASSAKTGIKVSNVGYRSIITIRRII
ncbi:MAG: C40 family peptidase [Lachnospiraceae bacterium]|nr:C40 family peptidase [Lachnospiraceae bacterium]